MNYQIIVLVFLQILIQNVTTCSQEKINSIYGLNPLLYNGQVYSYTLPASVQGNQYLSNNEFISGSVTIHDKTFHDLLLNYDIYNQEIILKFESDYKTSRIKLNKEKINSFSLGPKNFKLIKDKEHNSFQIYQLFGQGKYVALYYWKKTLDLIDKSGNTYWSFSRPQKTMYLQIKNQKYKFKNKRNLLSHFEKSQKNKIKNYLKENKINIKRISDIQLTQLINFCNNL